MNSDLFEEIMEVYKYIDYSNLIDEYNLAIATLSKLEAEQRLFASKHDIIQEIQNDIDHLEKKTANLTKELAEGVAFREYNDTLKKSPWFNEHGTFTNSVRKPIYVPEGNQIELVAASDSAHVLGMQLWCLVGDTKVVTSDGVLSLKELSGHTAKLLQYDYDKSAFVYVDAPVVLTKYVQDTIKITLEDGTIFEGTPEHQVMLVDGTYKRLDELTDTDEVLSL
jgi:hypothetical protein